MEEYIRLLRANGCKITPQRRAVLAALLACGRFPTAQEVWEHVRRENPDVGFDTVYRNLNMLVALGVVSQISVPGRDGNIFELVQVGHHHHHAICLKCGKAACLEYCPIIDRDAEKAVEAGFTITSHALQFFGYCRECGPSNRREC